MVLGAAKAIAPPSQVGSRTRAADAGALAQMAERARDGDAQALRELLRMLAPTFHRLTRQVLGPTPGADDAMQDAMIAFCRDLRHLQHGRAVLAYASRLTLRAAVHARRKRSRDLARVEGVDPALESEMPPPDVEVGARVRVARLLELVDVLPPEQAEAFVMRCVLEHDLGEVAEMAGVGINTIRSRIRLARQRLARMVQEDALLRAEVDGDG